MLTPPYAMARTADRSGKVRYPVELRLLLSHRLLLQHPLLFGHRLWSSLLDSRLCQYLLTIRPRRLSSGLVRLGIYRSLPLAVGGRPARPSRLAGVFCSAVTGCRAGTVANHRSIITKEAAVQRVAPCDHDHQCRRNHQRPHQPSAPRRPRLNCTRPRTASPSGLGPNQPWIPSLSAPRPRRLRIVGLGQRRHNPLLARLIQRRQPVSSPSIPRPQPGQNDPFLRRKILTAHCYSRSERVREIASVPLKNSGRPVHCTPSGVGRARDQQTASPLTRNPHEWTLPAETAVNCPQASSQSGSRDILFAAHPRCITDSPPAKAPTESPCGDTPSTSTGSQTAAIPPTRAGPPSEPVAVAAGLSRAARPRSPLPIG